MPKATLCVPAYNSAHTIAETLESLLAQTYRDSEIIVSDNHSTDDTREVVARYRNRGVRLVTCPCQPVTSGTPLDNCLSAIQNWNSLCDLGTGEYVGIYHADDLYEPELVARQVDALERRPDGSAAFPTCNIVDAEGRPVGSAASVPSVHPGEEWFGQVPLLRRMLRRGHYISSSGPLIRRKAWHQAGRLDGVKFEQAVDTEFWIRLAGVGPVAVLDPPLVRRREHPGQDSRNGLQLYRHRVLPIIPVLQHWASQASVSGQLDKEDRVHLAAACAEQHLRVAINLCHDACLKEARDVLHQLPPCGASVIRVLWRGHCRLALARLLAGKVLLYALHCGVGERAAAALARSRVGFPEWR
jgi:GT2 family glycosyltransferase